MAPQKTSAVSPLPTGKDTMSPAIPLAVNYHRWIEKLMIPWVSGRTLEIGAGYGQYTDFLKARSQSLVATDIDAAMVAKIRAARNDIEAKQADLSTDQFAKAVGVAAFDTIVCLNVLEHLKDDVGALLHMKQALKPGGKLFLFVPAHQALYGKLDELAGHFRRYSRGSMRDALLEAGFRVNRVRYFNPVGGLGWWVQAKFGKVNEISDEHVSRQVLIFDKYLQPVSALLDPLTSSWFGQSLWAVGERSE